MWLSFKSKTTKASRRPHGFALSAASQSAISKFETNSIFVNQIATVLISGTFQMRLIGSDLYERSPHFPRVLFRYHLFPLGIQRPQEWRLLLIGAHVRLPVTLESCLKIWVSTPVFLLADNLSSVRFVLKSRTLTIHFPEDSLDCGGATLATNKKSYIKRANFSTIESTLKS